MTTSISLVDLKAVYRRLQTEIDAATARVMSSGWYILGPEVAAFESEFAAYLGVEQAVGVLEFNGVDVGGQGVGHARELSRADKIGVFRVVA